MWQLLEWLWLGLGLIVVVLFLMLGCFLFLDEPMWRVRKWWRNLFTGEDD